MDSRLILLLVFAMMSSACATNTQNMQSNDNAYHPSFKDECTPRGEYKQKDGSTLYWGNTVFSEFYIGACCKTLDQAKKHYEEYVKFSDPIDGDSWKRFYTL